MLETRTLCLYISATDNIAVPQKSFRSRSWTSRTARPRPWTCRIKRATPKTPTFSNVYLCWTSRTAISGFYMMRVHARVLLPIFHFFCLLSHHINFGICCPRCPFVDFVEQYHCLHVHLSVRFFWVHVLDVQKKENLLRLVKKDWWKGFATPLGQGTVQFHNALRGGATPQSCQSNCSKNSVVRVVRVDAWLSRVNAHG